MFYSEHIKNDSKFTILNCLIQSLLNGLNWTWEIFVRCHSCTFNLLLVSSGSRIRGLNGLKLRSVENRSRETLISWEIFSRFLRVEFGLRLIQKSETISSCFSEIAMVIMLSFWSCQRNNLQLLNRLCKGFVLLLIWNLSFALTR